MKLVHSLLLGTLLSPILCRAQTACPWINAATATNAPSGFAISANQIAVAVTECRFHYQDGGVVYELRVTVQDIKNGGRGMDMKEAECTSKKIPLPGIGNEAVLCGADMRSSLGEQVIGRVRDRIFTVVASAETGRHSPGIRQLLCDKAEGGAEQVAGNLF